MHHWVAPLWSAVLRWSGWIGVDPRPHLEARRANPEAPCAFRFGTPPIRLGFRVRADSTGGRWFNPLG